MARFAKISVGAGKTFDANKLSPEMQAAIKAGMADALKEQAEFKRSQIDTGKKTPADLFGTREFLKNNYLYHDWHHPRHLQQFQRGGYVSPT